MTERLPAPELPPWLAERMPFERYCVRVGGRLVHVAETGSGRPVVMLHGNPTWSFLWRRVAEALVQEVSGVRVIMPDLVGLGLSEKPGTSFHTFANHARVIGSLFDALGLSDVVFVGQDWGGPIGVRALADRPGMATGLVLLNTIVTPPKPGFRPTSFHRFANVPLVSTAAFRLGEFPQRVLFLSQGDPLSIHGDVARAYRWPLRRLRDRAAPLALARMVPDSLDHPSVEGLRRCETFVEGFRGPAAIVWGERDPILGRTLGRLQKVLPHALVTRTNAGHFLQEEIPDVIAHATRDVVARATN